MSKAGNFLSGRRIPGTGARYGEQPRGPCSNLRRGAGLSSPPDTARFWSKLSSGKARLKNGQTWLCEWLLQLGAEVSGYSLAPNTNQVLTVVDTNYGVHGVQSSRFYTHFSLLKSIEAGLGLPCLNHACDASTSVMSDLFRGRGED